jgi:hypothetical protein
MFDVYNNQIQEKHLHDEQINMGLILGIKERGGEVLP